MDKNDKIEKRATKTSDSERGKKISEALKKYYAEHPRKYTDEYRKNLSDARKRTLAEKGYKTKQQIEQELDEKIEELERRKKAGEIDLEEFMRLRSMAVNHAEGEITRLTPPKKTFWQTEQSKIRL